MAVAAASIATGGALGGLIGASTSLAGAIGTGAAAGAAGGFVTGFTAGVANDMSFEKALYRGMQAMGVGALGGAFLGGLMYGVNELWNLSSLGDSLTYRDLPCLGSCATSGASYVPSVSDAASPLYSPLIPPWAMSTVPGASSGMGSGIAQLYPAKGHLYETPAGPGDNRYFQKQEFMDGHYYRYRTPWACIEGSWFCLNNYSPWKKFYEKVIEVPGRCQWMKCSPAEDNLKMKIKPPQTRQPNAFLINRTLP